MKKWFKFFTFSFFSHSVSKEAGRRSYVNTFFSFVIALAFIFGGFVGAAMLPFGTRYNSASDFRETAYLVFANANEQKRIDAEIVNGDLKLKKYGSDNTPALLINTYDSEEDRLNYSVNGYGVVVDTRPANTLAEVEAYCVSNDGKNTVITYGDYLTLSDVARLNFDFKLKYTGRELVLSEEKVAGYVEYLNSADEKNKSAYLTLATEFAEGRITKDAYERKLYELYFKSYYPQITEYEKTSAVPLLRNYYYHEYVNNSIHNYLFVFDDSITGSFKTDGGIDISFQGFFSEHEDGVVVREGCSVDEARRAVDAFIKDSYKALTSLNCYVYFINTFSLLPFIALMLMVAAILSYSVLKLKGVECIGALGAVFRIVGSYTTVSGAVAMLLGIAISFFVPPSFVNALPPVLFFVTLLIRTAVFTVKEIKLYLIKSEQIKAELTED